MPSELAFFHKGLNYSVRSALQDPGSLRTCENIALEKDGDQGLRTLFTNINTTAVNAIHSIRRFRDCLLIGDSTYLRSRAATSIGDFTSLYASFTNSIWRTCEYKNFLHCVNGNEQALFDPDGNLFPGTVANPTTVASLAASGSGTWSGHYMGYVSYYITWPNGMTYETGLSSASADCEASSDAQIDWTAIPVCPYAAHYVATGYDFNQVVLLLHGEGTDESQTISDSSPGAKTITVSGNTKIDTAQYKFGTASIYFDGTGDYISAPDSADWNMGTADWTIRFWVYIPSLSANMGFWQQRVSADNEIYFEYLTSSNGTLRFLIQDTGSTTFYALCSAQDTHLTINTWHQIEIVGTSGAVKIAVDGSFQIITSVGTLNWKDISAVFEIGRVIDFNGTTKSYTGWIDEFEVMKGVAMHTAYFTVPTEARTYCASIQRKLYRGPGTGGTLTDIYYLDTIHDNSTVTYTDTVTSDVTLATYGACVVDDYGPGPTKSNFIEYHYGLAFWIDADNSHRLWFSEAATGDTSEENENILPIACLSTNWDDLRVAGFERVDPQGIVSWGPYLYIALKHTWIKKQGNDADTWTYKKVWAKIGVSAPHTIDISSTPAGILSVSQNVGGETGISLFNGAISQIITSPKYDYIFNTHLDIDYIHKCRAVCAGHYYVLAYPSTSAVSGEPDTIAAFDMRHYPDIRLAMWCDLAGRSLSSYNQGGVFYIGGSDGKARKSDSASTEAVDVVVETHDLIGGNVIMTDREKHLKNLRYSLDSGSANVTMTIYIDGTAATWPDATTYKTITGSSETVQYMAGFPPNFRGYRFRIHLSASALTTWHLYSPWEVEFDVTP